MGGSEERQGKRRARGIFLALGDLESAINKIDEIIRKAEGRKR